MTEYKIIDGDMELTLATIHDPLIVDELAQAAAEAINGCVQIWKNGQMVREVN